MEILFLIGRIIFGGYMLQNAWNHFKNTNALAGYAHSMGVPSPKVAVLGSGALLAFGGISVVLWTFPTVGLGALLLFFIPVTYKMHQYWKIQDLAQRAVEHINFYKNLAIVGAILMLFVIARGY